MKNTRDHLRVLSRGQIDYDTVAHRQLVANKDRFLEAFKQYDANVELQKSRLEVSLPFVEALRRKVASTIATPDSNLPIISRFDLYTAIRSMSDRTTSDAGLRRLASQLEAAWHADPVGVLTYENVTGLVRHYRDVYPRSIAATAIESECTRSGMHKLPVAKLSRIASKISSQQDYDALIEANGLGGSRPDQVRSRTFIRSLVSMRSAGATTTDRVSGSILSKYGQGKVLPGQRSPGNDMDKLLMSINTVDSLAAKMEQLLANAANVAFVNNLENVGQHITDLQHGLDAWVSRLDSIRSDAAPATPPVYTPPPPPPPPKSVEEQDIEDAGIGRSKLWDPRTWFASVAGDTVKLARQASTVSELFDGEAAINLIKISTALNDIVAQLSPQLGPTEPHSVDDLGDAGTTGDGGDGGDAGDSGDAGDAGDGIAQPDEVSTSVDILNTIDDVAHDVVTTAPPDVQDWVQHEMTEGGHTSVPGTATWGAEEILLEDHTAPPPSDAWLSEELSEIKSMPSHISSAPPGMEDVVMKLKTQYPNDPDRAFATAWSIYNKQSAKNDATANIPLPSGKIKAQPDVTTCGDAPPDDAGKLLTSSMLESYLLSGKRVRSGDISIHINPDNEVELWDKTSGRACPLLDMDTAINDFLVLAGVSPKKSQLSGQAYEVDLTYPKNSFKDDVAARAQVLKLLNDSGDGVKIDAENGGRILATVWGADGESMDRFLRRLQQMRGTANVRRVGQVLPPLAVSPTAPSLPDIGAPSSPVTDVSGVDVTTPISEVIEVALSHYKNLGMSYGEAISQLRKDYKERESEIDSSEGGGLLLSIGNNLWASGAGGMAPPADVVFPTGVEVIAAGMVDPKIRVPSDHVPVPPGMGDVGSDKDSIPCPSVDPNSNKPSGKMSPTDMSLGKGKGIPVPKNIKVDHPPADQPGIKLSDTDMSTTSKGLKVPAPGSKPSIKK